MTTEVTLELKTPSPLRSGADGAGRVHAATWPGRLRARDMRLGK
jgi:hypothetical protein